jgi:hypothetical protein
MESRLRRVKQRWWPKYAWNAELAATLSLDSPRFGGMALLKITILGLFLVVEAAKLCQ